MLAAATVKIVVVYGHCTLDECLTGMIGKSTMKIITISMEIQQIDLIFSANDLASRRRYAKKLKFA